MANLVFWNFSFQKNLREKGSFFKILKNRNFLQGRFDDIIFGNISEHFLKNVVSVRWI